MSETPPIHVLIVEDERGVTLCLARCMAPIQKEFPGARIDVAYSWNDTLEQDGRILPGARQLIFDGEPPTIVLLDLTMPDSDFMTTLSQVPAILARSALLIVTGRHQEEIERRLGPVRVEILNKGDAMVPGTIIPAMVRAMSASRFAALDGIIDRLHEKGYGPTPPTT